MRVLRVDVIKRNVRAFMVFITSMLAFMVIAMSAGERDTYAELFLSRSAGEAADARHTDAAADAAPPFTHVQKSRGYSRNVFFRDMAGGLRSPEEIQNDIAQVVGDNDGVEFTRDHINRAYKLTMILTHFKNMLDNPYEILFVHTLADKGFSEDAMTFYSRKLDGVEERNTRTQVSLPRLIEIGDNGQPQFAPASRVQYKFFLEPNNIKRNFDLREPVGAHAMTAESPQPTFDPLSVLSNLDIPFDRGLYHKELVVGGKIYDVKVTIRPTDIETLTIETRVKELDSLVEQTFVLVYEEL